jgi:hypothetical protein
MAPRKRVAGSKRTGKRRTARRSRPLDVCSEYHKVRDKLVWLSDAPWMPPPQRQQIKQYIALMDAVCPRRRRAR